ncbi:hypothetical protein NBRC116494_29750 [Aurantivibrio plasticivorans]
MKKILVLLFISCFISSCSSTHTSVGYAVTLCCPGNYSQYTNYTLQTQDIPAFLTDTITQNFDLAFQEKGLGKVHLSNHKNPSLAVTLRYVHVNLNAEQERPVSSTMEKWERHESYSQALSYMATIEINIREFTTKELVWSGQVQRRHHVQPGEYMHEDRASGDILMAFRDVLMSYPSLEADKNL